MRTRTLLIGAALLGLVLGPALDQIHVRTGALAYAHPWWLDQAWWVGLQFAVAFAAIAAGALSVTDRDGPAAPPRTLHVLWTVAAFVLAYLVTGLGHEREGLVLLLLLSTWLGARLVLERPDRAALVVLALLAIGGTAYEATLSSIPRTFDYAVASFGPVPAWLPLLYAHAALAVVPLLRAASASETP